MRCPNYSAFVSNRIFQARRTLLSTCQSRRCVQCNRVIQAVKIFPRAVSAQNSVVLRQTVWAYVKEGYKFCLLDSRPFGRRCTIPCINLRLYYQIWSLCVYRMGQMCRNARNLIIFKLAQSSFWTPVSLEPLFSTSDIFIFIRQMAVLFQNIQ